MMTMPNVKDTSGLTIEGFQEFYDEACLAVLNNKYNDGIQWHDVPCYFRSHYIVLSKPGDEWMISDRGSSARTRTCRWRG